MGRSSEPGSTLLPEDATTSPQHIRQAVRQVPNMVPERDTLLVISFAYEAPATAGEYQNMGSVQVIRAEANKDLTIPGLKNSPGDNSFVVVGEPDVELRKTTDGQLELEVRGVDTYDPKINTVRAGEVRDIHCIMTDTDFDGLSFRVRRINFPNQTKDKQLERMKQGPEPIPRQREVESSHDSGNHSIRPTREREDCGQSHRQGRNGNDESSGPGRNMLKPV